MSPAKILVDPREVQQGLAERGWIAVDCRFELGDVSAGRRAYDAGHLPGAVFLDLDEDLAGPVTERCGRHPLPDAATLSAKLGQLGIQCANTVVVYDEGNGAIAARGWWILRWLGMKSVYLLNGGHSNWARSGLPIESGCATREPALFTIDESSTQDVSTAELAADISRIRNRNLLDARDRRRFRGEHEPIDPVAGHIPGAVNLPFNEFVNKDGTWLSVAERVALLEAVLGEDRGVVWSVMCGSGVTACHLAISGLEAGYREPQVYVGSWSEWIRDPGRPIGRSCE